MRHDFLTIYCQDCLHEHPVPVYCGDRFCPICTRQVRARTRRRLDWIIDHVPEMVGYRWYMITLSEPNCSDIREGLKSLIASFRRLRSRQYWMNKIFGGIYVIEIKGRPGNWHPHIHAVIYSRWLYYPAMIRQWQKCSKGTACWIDKIPTKEVTRYITKYMSKPDVPDAVMNGINQGLKGTRWLSPFGQCHNIKFPQPKHKSACPECQGELFFMDMTRKYKDVQCWYNYLDLVSNRAPPELITTREIKQCSATSELFTD